MGQITSAINIQSLSWDMLAILFLLVASIFYGLLLGKNRIILLMLSTYSAFAIYSIFPFSKISAVTGNLFFLKFGVFLIFMAISFIFFNRSFFGHLFKVSKALSNISFFKIMILSFFQIGLFMSIFFGIVLTDSARSISPLTKLVFTGSIPTLLWFLAPLLFVGLFKGRKQEGK